MGGLSAGRKNLCSDNLDFCVIEPDLARTTQKYSEEYPCRLLRYVKHDIVPSPVPRAFNWPVLHIVEGQHLGPVVHSHPKPSPLLRILSLHKRAEADSLTQIMAGIDLLHQRSEAANDGSRRFQVCAGTVVMHRRNDNARFIVCRHAPGNEPPLWRCGVESNRTCSYDS